MSSYAVIDLEMCRVPKRFKKEGFMLRNELIQIGAVLLDEAHKVVDSFMTYVLPEYGRVDSYIEGLTGISNDDLKDAPKAEEALEMFAQWLPHDAMLVAWSDNDEKQIVKETEAKGLSVPELDNFMDRWVDCQKTFAEKMDNQRNYKLSEALVIADIESEVGEHDALIDAKNTALLFAKMESGEEFTINPYLSGESSAEFGGYTPFANLLATMQIA